MKLFQVIALIHLYEEIKDCPLPIRTTYKFAMLMQKVQPQIDFYNSEFNKIVDTYAQKDENGDFIFSKDNTAIAIIEGKEEECNSKITELQNLEVDMDEIKFTLDELDGLSLSIEQINMLMPLILA